MNNGYRNYKIWEGEYGNRLYRIVATSDNTAVVEVRQADSMSEPCWHVLRNPNEQCQIMTTAIFDMRNVFEEEIEKIVQDIKQDLSSDESHILDAEYIVNQVDEELLANEEKDLLSQINSEEAY